MIAGVLLAAGGSVRLGRPKQLLRHRGESLVRRAAAAIVAGGCSPVLVVVGTAADEIAPELHGLDVRVVVNAESGNGLSSSIRAGVRALFEAGDPVRAIALFAADQYRLDAAVVRRVLAAFDEVPGRTVASSYAGTVGVPAVFDASLVADLLLLSGDRGAKELLIRQSALRVDVPWPEGARDVDRETDRIGLE